ncbi:MAG TPA: methyltransferase domain-containing protein [Puia sp.]|nr:methyltransferase domain-containing protein [Puia sp.]
MHYQSHFNTSVKLIEGFDGSIPLKHYLKKYFGINKKFGSNDRKYITELCYSYFRLGHACRILPVEEKMMTAIFLCNYLSNGFLAHYKPEWNKTIHFSLKEKLAIIDYPFSITDVFPWKDQLSAGIDHEKFCESFLVQPDLFLRIRPGKEASVINKLAMNNIQYRRIDETYIALGNATKIDGVLEINKEVVIQDYSSQKTAAFFPLPARHVPIAAWDCCAGSGGKSILLVDLNKNVKLTVSDIRESILANLKKRFVEAGITKYQSFITDLSTPKATLKTQKFDLIIADVPCSGSGTWSRTPEALYFFKKNEIERFKERQNKILTNIIPCLKNGGHLVYLTCSVFKKENEEVTDLIQSKFHLELVRSEVLRGYDKKGDTMYAASFTV